MKKILITGATGMTGGIVLKHCLQSAEIGEIISFVRRHSAITHDKLNEVVIENFIDYSASEEHFKNIDIVYFCIGVYTGTVPDEKFKEITVDYTVAFVDMLKKHSPNAQFCFLSGAGADQTEKNKMSFAKYKGMAENYIIKTLKNVNIFRPSYIYPVEKRNEPNLTYKISRFLYPLIKSFGNKYSIKSTELGEAIYKTGVSGNEQTILENNQILKIVG